MTVDHSAPHKSRILNALLWSAASSWSTKLLDFIVVLILARQLTPADFGLVALVTIYIAFANIFVEGGFAQAIIQREEIEELHLATAFWASVSIGSLLTVGTYFFGPSTFELVFNESGIGAIVQVTSVLFIVTSLSSVQQAILTRRLEFKSLALRQAGGTLAGGLTAVTLAFLGFGVWSLVALHMVNAVVRAVILWAASEWRPSRRFSFACLKQLFAFGVYIVGRKLLAFFNRRGLNLVIGIFLGTTALGYYTLASRIVMSALDFVTATVQSVAFPAFSRLQGRPAKLRNAYYKAISFTSLISYPAFLWIASTASLVVPLLLGPKWLQSIAILQVLCLVGLLDSVLRYSFSVMLACGKANWTLYIACTHAIGSLVGFFVAVKWGLVAVAAAYVIASFLLAPLAVGAVRRLVHITYRDYFRRQLPALVGSIAMLTTILLTKVLFPTSIPITVQLLGMTLAGVVVYVFTIQLVDRSTFRNVTGLLMDVRSAAGGRNAGKEL
jgi:PST family polysaccharide transporter